MINHGAQRFWGAAPFMPVATLSVTKLIDLLLDRIENIGTAIAPEQIAGTSCSEMDADPFQR